MTDSKQTDVTSLSLDELAKHLVARQEDSHKGDFGHTLLLGGCAGFSGAIRLAGESALRIGSGLVSVATHMEHSATIAMARPELMCHGVTTANDVKELIKKCNVIAVGPGLGQTSWSYQIFSSALDANLPLVVDADALNLLSKERVKSNNWVLTPHVGEAARLLNCTSADIQSDRLMAVKQIQQEYGGVVVLKGKGSLVFDGQETISICDAGNPGMASGGMGDVLTGVIAGLIAQGLSALNAAKLGVIIHATAGDLAAVDGERGLLASDLMPFIRRLANGY
jgi:hydroxyethylthiazole kinase-like uncharacterized protein yjeF